MILKIEWCNGWLFQDKFERLEIIEVSKKEAEERRINKQFVIKRAKEDNDRVKMINLFKEGCDLFQVIVIDINQAYLLNDEGKTIERIN